MSERQSFEAWWERAHNNGSPPRFGWQHWRSGDGYLVDDDDEEFQWRWEAWQASREALKAEQAVSDAWIACADRMSNPTHWLPLPAPPSYHPIDTTSQQYEALSKD